jgi:hypothetical protein
MYTGEVDVLPLQHPTLYQVLSVSPHPRSCAVSLCSLCCIFRILRCLSLSLTISLTDCLRLLGRVIIVNDVAIGGAGAAGCRI